MLPSVTRRAPGWHMLCFICHWGWVAGQLHYSVLEETDPGTAVGNVARDLGVGDASERRLRLGSQTGRRYFVLSTVDGALLVNETIDRESLCGSSASCVLSEEVLAENPLQLFRLEVQVLDQNDNAPNFPTASRLVRITELLTTPGTRFPLESAQDPDVGVNTIKGYRLNPTPYFSLSLKHRKDGTLLPELVLDKLLDREEQAEHHLVLTAFDGGQPAKSGITRITVSVLDVNDHAPAFEHSVYKVALTENCPTDTLLITLSATDHDDGPNGDVEYAFDEHNLESAQNMFSLNPLSGEIRTRGTVDFEDSSFYELYVRAKDHGLPELEGRCVVHVTIEDLNDNAPVILLNSLAPSVPENTPVGTAVGMFQVADHDSGLNGEVRIELSPNLPFQIESFENHYSLVTSDILDREQHSQFSLELTVTDMGTPTLHTQTTFSINISDVNDNPPRFSKLAYTAHIAENNDPGACICTLSASDPDEGDNALLTYSITASYTAAGLLVPSFVYMNPLSGAIYVQRSLDYESIQVLHISVMVEDAGSPKLNSSATVYLFVVDQNDNAPSVLYPVTSKELVALQNIPQDVPRGYLISKVSAVDPDSGHNAWLSYSLLQSTESSLFRIAPHTGEIQTTRQFKDTDAPEQSLVILIKDNGQPALSTTVTLLITLADIKYESMPRSHDFLAHADKSKVTQYLIISLVVISLVALVTFGIIFAKCLRKGDYFGSSLCCPAKKQSAVFSMPSQRSLQLDKDGTLKYVEVCLGPSDPLSQPYRTRVLVVSERGDSDILRPLNFPQLKDTVNGSHTLLPGTHGPTEYEQQAQPFQQSQPFQQAPPNTDWRFSQAQRPGTSGSQNSEEAGGWPNNQFETERLQAMILASANEGADGSSTLGGGAGTMGLSTRYGPQFTLQHVPDYRQNVYIPGSTATLTNAAGKRDGKSAAASGGNKKKSGKKEKK
ncbi:protocadherin gamma-C5-like isoform X7 [Ambystoma mexicanum]|uniref:protocadherin gamma-C5-like isoform X7 n=1 Tax=Ambystoma mexicanum TaxID=8296 RepID=UPI0037E7E4B7